MAALPEMVTIHYERKFSDGNYGSEGISLQITYGVDADGTTDEAVAAHIRFLRQTVLSRLAASPATLVARAAQRELGDDTGGVSVKVTNQRDQPGLEDLPF